MFRKTLSLMLAALMLIAVFAGCKTPEPEIPDTEVTTTEEQEPVETEPPEIPVELEVGDLSKYTVIRTEDEKKTVEIASALKLRNAIIDKTGGTPGIKDDWIKRGDELPETAKEILVGITNRKESTELFAKLREKDFAITYENERIIILGGSSEATGRAVDYFIENYINSETKKLTVYENRCEIVRFGYIYGTLSIDGVPLSDYTVVYPEGCDKITYYCALNLVDCVKNYAGVEMTVSSDTAAETEYELLVGETNRKASYDAAMVALKDDEYILCKTGNKVVMLGNSYMSGAAAGVLMNDYFISGAENTDVDVKNLPTSAKAEKFTFPKARNAILIIGDGMGRNQVQSTLDAKKLDVFVADLLPSRNYCVTESRSVQLGKAGYTDSAASATALATGFKTLNKYLGIDENKKTLLSLRELAYSKNARTSILTTDKITGATPCAFLVHYHDRDAAEELQSQINAVINAGAVNYCKGSVGDDLLNCTRESLAVISENRSQFFTMIEEAYPDKGGHNNDINVVNNAVVRINETVAYAIGFTMLHPDTVLIVTADHETGGLTKNTNGTYSFTSKNHTNADVPVYAIGDGTSEFLSKMVDNTEISKFIAKIYTSDKFGC